MQVALAGIGHASPSSVLPFSFSKLESWTAGPGGLREGRGRPEDGQDGRAGREHAHQPVSGTCISWYAFTLILIFLHLVI